MFGFYPKDGNLAGAYTDADLKFADMVESYFTNFARTGNPSQPGLTWEPTDPDSSKTMVFDNECRMVNDPESEARKILLS